MMPLKERIINKQAKIAVIGLGYVGLPLSVALAKVGHSIIGIDTNKEWVHLINLGISNIIDVPSEELKVLVDTKKIVAEADYRRVREADVIIICVPTPLNIAKEPDLSYIMKAVESMMPYLQKGSLVSLESTTYPGTTEELIVHRIEQEKSWKVGEDFYVCYSPERVDPGNPHFSVENTAKVVGGSTKACLETGVALYESFLPKVVSVKSTKVAEMSKVLENTFRCVNIALMNEMAMMCERMNIDIWEVIKGASSKPFGFMPFYPGPGVGGHCIPLDPLYLSWEAKKYNYFSRFIETASDINSNMPYYVVRQIEQILGKCGKLLKKSHILLIGMSYKKDIGDLRESSSLEVYELLTRRGSDVAFYDPYVESFKDKEDNMIKRTALDEAVLKQVDVVVILTDHSKIDYEFIIKNADVIYDTRNACASYESEKVIKLGDNLE